MKYPTIIPQRMPTMTARGKAVAGSLKLTPPTKTTASSPSRSKVMKGRTNMAYFRDLAAMPLLSRSCMIWEILTFHFFCRVEIRSIARPMTYIVDQLYPQIMQRRLTVMRMDAIMQNTDSQMSSAEPQTSRARVYHTAMNAAPRHRQSKKPRPAPSHI